MVQELGIDASAWATSGARVLDTTYIVVLGIIVLGLIGLLIYFFLEYRRYNKTVIVREITNKGERVRSYRAKQILDEKKVYWWKLWGEPDKLKRFIPQPPDEAIDVKSNGKDWVELKRTSDGTCIFLKDNSKIAPYPVEILKKIPDKIAAIEDIEQKEKAIKEWKQKTFLDWKKTNNIDFTFQPFTTTQRTLMTGQLRSAEERRGNSLWDSIPQVVGIISVVIIVVCLMIFWGDIAQPALEGKQLTRQILELQQQNLKIIQEMQQDIQVISSEQLTSSGSQPRTSPPN